MDNPESVGGIDFPVRCLDAFRQRSILRDFAGGQPGIESFHAQVVKKYFMAETEELPRSRLGGRIVAAAGIRMGRDER
jgi:hypothetical protein